MILLLVTQPSSHKLVLCVHKLKLVEFQCVLHFKFPFPSKSSWLVYSIHLKVSLKVIFYYPQRTICDTNNNNSMKIQQKRASNPVGI